MSLGQNSKDFTLDTRLLRDIMLQQSTFVHILHASMMESDLYTIVEKYYIAQGFSVKGEVCGCDLVAIREDKIIIVELKKSFNVKLLYQGIRRLSATEYVYVAFFKPKTKQSISFWTMIKSLCRRLHIGAILVEDNNLRFLLHPEMFQARKSTMQRKKILKEFHGRKVSENKGGITGQKLETAYLESAIKIAVILSENGALSAKDLQIMGTSENTHTILYRNHYGWFEKKEKGIYFLKKGLSDQIREDYPKIWQYYASEHGM